MPLKLLPVEGIDATIANINNHTFPLARPLNLVVKTAPKGLTKDFIDFAQSEKATPIVKRQAFVPIFP
jgi:phosphate transport system substrate-binding protein